VSYPNAEAANKLRHGLRADRRRLLPREQGDLDRHLLPGRTGAKRPE
jgi:hypothetical protein